MSSNSDDMIKFHIVYSRKKHLGILKESKSISLSLLRKKISSTFDFSEKKNFLKDFIFICNDSEIKSSQESSLFLSDILITRSKGDFIIRISPIHSSVRLNKTINFSKVLSRLPSVTFKRPSNKFSTKITATTSDMSINSSSNHSHSNTFSHSNTDKNKEGPVEFLKEVIEDVTDTNNKDKFLFMSVQSDDEDFLSSFCKALGLHHLHIEDIVQENFREKIEVYDYYDFLILKDPFVRALETGNNMKSVDEESSLLLKNYLNRRASKVRTNIEKKLFERELYIYIIWSRNGVIAFSPSKSTVVQNFLKRIRERKIFTKSLKAAHVVHGLLDIAVDITLGQVKFLSRECEKMEQALYKSDFIEDKDGFVEKLKDLKKFNFELKKGIQPKKNILNMIIGSNIMNIYKDVPKAYFLDILDHIDFISMELNEMSAFTDNMQNYYMSKASIEMNKASAKSAELIDQLTLLNFILLPIQLFGAIMGANIRVPFQTREDVKSLRPFWMSISILVIVMIGLYSWIKSRKKDGK